MPNYLQAFAKSEIVKRFFCIALCFLLCLPLVAQRKRQMRAAWIATVVGIDWPPSVNDVRAQKQSMLDMLDTLQALHFNAVFFQVRPTADAFYRSEIEPWSRYLTGTQGIAPDPEYDPLAFVVREAHRRCIEVHAWINPYRATLKGPLSQLDSAHIYYLHPEWFVRYGEQLLFNPAKAEVRDYLNRVVADIVSRYDIDAVHLDDYFYPYRYKKQEFPDEADFRADPRGFTDKGDWRRDNVNLVMAQLQQTIKALKPWVEFGVSPFGVWRNRSRDERGSNTHAMTNYDDLYADILLWLERGYIDYVVPQLYWEIGHKTADFATLAEWWSANSYGKNFYIGYYASRLGDAQANEAWQRGNEVMRQLHYADTLPQQGAAFYSTVALMQNRQGLRDSLHQFFTLPAIVPLRNDVPADGSASVGRVRIVREHGRHLLEWDAPRDTAGCAARYYVVYAFKGSELGDFSDPQNILAVTSDNCLILSDFAERLHGGYRFAVTAINRYKQESAPATIRKKTRVK